MRILNNINSSHFNELKELINDADELYIISPFLMESFDVFFNEIIAPSDVKRIVMVTTLKDNDPDLFKKANSLHSLVANCFLVQLNHLYRLIISCMGKIYISCKNNHPQKGIITSANFTNRGLNHNHEWGILTDDADSLKTIISDITKVSSHALTLKEI